MAADGGDTDAVEAAQTSSQRPFKVDDLFDLESIGQYFGGPYAFSTDEQKLAFTRLRPDKELANYSGDYLWGNAGGDVWVRLSPDADPVNITDGATDGSGWWAPQWSPDGEKLAMLSTRGGNVRAWVWDSETRQLRQISARGVDIVNIHERPYLWVDSDHLLVPVLSGDDEPLFTIINRQTPAIATAEWPKAAKGDEVTASVLQSGVPNDLGKRPRGDLLLIDASTGTSKSIFPSNTRSWLVSPGGNAVAFPCANQAYP